MFNVSFWTFKKDIDSTKRPAGNPAAAFSNCDIVQPFSVEDPEIIVSDNRAASWNYLYITEFERYYFVNGRTFVDGLWFLKCHVDVLATYKPDIGAEQLYILRSSAARNGYIPDKYYPITGKISTAMSEIDTTAATYAGGYYILQAVGDNTGNSTIYQLSPADFATLCRQLMGTIDRAQWVDVIEAIKNTLFRPMDYIRSAMWVPEAFSTSSTVAVKLGHWESGVTAGVITNPVKIKTHNVSIPKHPQEGRGKYLNGAPFSEYLLAYDPFGLIPLDASKLVDCDTLHIEIFADALTGNAILQCGALADGSSGSGYLASVSAPWGVPVPLTGAQIAGAGGVSLVTNTFTPQGVLNNVAGFADALTSGGAVSTIGGSGSIVAHDTVKLLGAVFHHVTASDNSKNGSPYMQQATPASLGGFMIVQRGDVAITGTQQEAAEIKAKLERGFYYE